MDIETSMLNRIAIDIYGKRYDMLTEDEQYHVNCEKEGFDSFYKEFEESGLGI